MLRPLLNSETTKTNGAMNPCHRPCQNPATEFSPRGVSLRLFGPGAQAVSERSRNAIRMMAASFMAEASQTIYVRGRGKDSSFFRSSRNKIDHGGTEGTDKSNRGLSSGAPTIARVRKLWAHLGGDSSCCS